MGRLGIVDLLIKIVGFVKKNLFYIIKAADLSYLVQGGQLY